MELKLYHGGFSVCSAKVRVGLAEKNFAWESFPIDLVAGEQFDPNYLKINRNGVVPSLIDDGTVITESSIILEHIDMLSPHNRLMPAGRMLQSATRLWLLRCLEIHAAINTMTFSTVNRHNILLQTRLNRSQTLLRKYPTQRRLQSVGTCWTMDWHRLTSRATFRFWPRCSTTCSQHWKRARG